MRDTSLGNVTMKLTLYLALFLALCVSVDASPVKKVSMVVTAYHGPCKRCGTGKYTRSGKLASRGGVAADLRYYRGYEFKINGKWYPVDDSGVCGRHRADLRKPFKTCKEARQWGRKKIMVEVRRAKSSSTHPRLGKAANRSK
jgi:3D (Asp-Asp-Asp) domain-containing protein